MKFVKKKITDLIPMGYNSRKDLKPGDLDCERLKRSMHEFGYVDPIAWNQQTGHAVGGHQRLKIFQDEGIQEVECAAVSLDDEKEKTLNTAFNKISGDWDKGKLALLMTDLQASDLDVSLTGFDENETSDLLDTADDTHDDDLDVDSESNKLTSSKAGDLWHLGRRTLLCGDATKKESFHKLLSDNEVNLVLTDPPYDVDYQSKVGKIKNGHQDNDKFYKFLLAALQNMNTAMANDASIYVFHVDTEGLDFRRAFQDAGFYLSGCCTWKKQSLVLGRFSYQWQHEPVLYGWKHDGKHEWYIDREESTVWKFGRPGQSKEHPTMKPIPLLAYPITNSTMSNRTVLDPSGGSGSILIACEQTNRICYMMELDPKYCDMTVNRYIKQVDSDQDTSVGRDGHITPYSNLKKPA